MTKVDQRYQILFDPIRIGPVTAPNRFYAVPHATGHGWNQPHGAIALRAMKAEGGWGTVAVQICEVSPDTDMASHPMERIWDDSDIPRHRAQVEAIKRHGSLAAIELGHGGMRARNITTAVPSIGPSALPCLRPEVPIQARAMSLDDIRAFRESHKAAAYRAKRAGYDILYVYAAHDLSILSHFLSIETNQRTDDYGGSFSNRLRLLKEVLLDTLEVANGEQAVALRFSVAEPERAGGLKHDGEGREVVEALAELPDLWDVNISGWPQDSATARFSEEGFQLPYTDFVKSLTSKPVVGVGRFTSPDTMVELIRQGRLDLIGAARPSIADPFLPNKIKAGQIEDIRECIGCNICVSMDAYGLPVRCTQNPTVSEEWRSGWHPEPPVLPARNLKTGRKHHLVIGAGPSGLECALTLVRAGHKVTVADAADLPGGRVIREAGLPGLGSWKRVSDYRLGQLSRSPDAELFLESQMNAELVCEFGADTVTIATGAEWRRDGVGSTNFNPVNFGTRRVVTPDDVMNDELPQLSSTVVIYDDDHFYMASVLAEVLCAAGYQVIYACPLPSVATWTDFTLDQSSIIQRMKQLGVQMYPNIALQHDGSFRDTLSGKPTDWEATDWDTRDIVFVGARIPREALLQELQAVKMTQLYSAGDCVSPGIIQAAVLSGHKTAQQILSPDGLGSSIRREQVIIQS